MKTTCPFCDVPQSKLTRHIQLVHKEVKEVSDAMNAQKGTLAGIQQLEARDFEREQTAVKTFQPSLSTRKKPNW